MRSKVDASLTSKFPFNADATADATIADVKAILTPDTGELWTFYADRLAKYLTKSGNKYVAKPVGGVELSESFVGFFNKAVEVSDALFAEDAANPHVTWNVSGVITETTPLVILKNNGLEARLDKQSFKNVVEWPATSGRQAELLARFKKNKELRVKLTAGEWAIFRLVASGDAFQGSLVTWNAAGLKDAEPVRLRFDAQQREAAPVLDIVQDAREPGGQAGQAEGRGRDLAHRDAGDLLQLGGVREHRLQHWLYGQSLGVHLGDHRRPFLGVRRGPVVRKPAAR